jgi:protein disulfide-isomerase
MKLRWTSRSALLGALALMALLPAACQRPAGEGAAPAVDDGAMEAEIGSEPGEAMGETGEDGLASPPDPYGEAYQVAWHEGSVDEAFEIAKAEDKPVFLYWGAVWCPPCHYLKEKVFKTESFAQKSQDFVMVELDGDTERAQALGEAFAVMGYPTVIVLDGDRNEIMRMSSGIPVDEYELVLDAAVAMRRPVGEVLDEVMAVGPSEAPPELLRMLAYYAWGQDDKIGLPAEEELATFRALFEGAPEEPRTVKSRFLAQYLDALISAAGDASDEAEEAGTEPEPVVDAEERAALAAQMTTVLEDPVLRNVNLWHVSYWSRETVELLFPEAGPERDAFAAAWVAASDAIQNDESLTVDDRLSGIYPEMEIYKLLNPPAPVVEAEEGAAGEGGDEGDEAAEGAAEEETPPALSMELQDKVRARVQWAAETAKEGGEMQAVMSSMIWLLGEAELEDEASALLEASLDKTLAPYYYMSSMSSMAETPEEKIAWRKRAWDESAGPATRFQWGLGYLSTLMNEAPEDAALIESETMAVLDELLQNEDAFHQRNQRRLSSLASSLESWNEEAEGAHDAVLARLRERVSSACVRYADAADEGAVDADTVDEAEAATEADAAEGAEGAENAADTAEEAAPDTPYTRCTNWLAPEPEEASGDA